MLRKIKIRKKTNTDARNVSWSVLKYLVFDDPNQLRSLNLSRKKTRSHSHWSTRPVDLWIGSEGAAAPVCPQNRAYGSVHGSSRKTDPQTNICSSVNRSLPFISLSLQKPFNDHWPLIHPMYTSRALLGSLRADLRPLVSNELP